MLHFFQYKTVVFSLHACNTKIDACLTFFSLLQCISQNRLDVLPAFKGPCRTGPRRGSHAQHVPSFSSQPERSTEHLLSHHKDTTDHSYSNYVGKSSHKYQPRTLFTNNNYNDDYEYTVSSYKRSTWISRVLRVFTSIFSVFYYVFEVQRQSVLWFGKKVHKAVSLVMLWDTWLLRRQPRNKLPAILLLCLLPLLFFGGTCLLSFCDKF